MTDIQEISEIISKNSVNHNRFINEYLLFLIEFLKRFEKHVYPPHAVLKAKAEQSVALALIDLKQYQTGHTSTTSLFSHYVKDSPMLGSTTSSLKVELSSLVKEMYSNNYWKEIALEALGVYQPLYPRIFFDLSPVRESRPWLSPDLKKNKRGKLHEQIN